MTIFEIHYGGGPLVATAIHDGHAVRQAIADRLALDEATRLREEDPYTGLLAAVFPTHILGRRSRFELDLNRDCEHAVYRKPEDAWGLQVWRTELREEFVAESLVHYDQFYGSVRALLRGMIAAYGAVVVLDIHSYNHRREGPEGACADCSANPEVNIGTGSVDRRRWGRLVDRLIGDLRQAEVGGETLDVRENVKFQGGHFPRWINDVFSDAACAIAIEFKKTFMDEWTGELDRRRCTQLQAALRGAIPGLLAGLRELAPGRRQEK
jgi:N-formylglutamate amidohydrolase